MEVTYVPAVMEWDCIRLCHTTHSTAQFTTYEYFVSEDFHIMFLESGELLVTKPLKAKTTHVEGATLMYLIK